MPGATVFEIEIAGEKQISRVLEGIEARAEDLRPVWDVIAQDFGRIVARQFATEGGLGRPWPPLSPAYAAWKARHYPGRPILVRTGRLKESLVGRTIDTVDERTRDSLTLGTAVPYAIYHQKGTKKMPPRPPIVIPEAAKDRWARAIHEFVWTGDVKSTLAARGIF